VRDVEKVLQRIRSGHKVTLHQDYYGRQWVKIRGGVMFWRTRMLPLRNEEAARVKDALEQEAEFKARKKEIRREKQISA
jgi:hypothetical protein